MGKKKATPITGTIQLGDRVRDKHSGFTGIVEVASEYLYQCRQFNIRPEGLDKDGKLHSTVWFDEPQLERLAEGVRKPQARVELAGVAVSGGPERSHPKPLHAR